MTNDDALVRRVRWRLLAWSGGTTLVVAHHARGAAVWRGRRLARGLWRGTAPGAGVRHEGRAGVRAAGCRSAPWVAAAASWTSPRRRASSSVGRPRARSAVVWGPTTTAGQQGPVLTIGAVALPGGRGPRPGADRDRLHDAHRTRRHAGPGLLDAAAPTGRRLRHPGRRRPDGRAPDARHARRGPAGRWAGGPRGLAGARLGLRGPRARAHPRGDAPPARVRRRRVARTADAAGRRPRVRRGSPPQRVVAGLGGGRRPRRHRDRGGPDAGARRRPAAPGPDRFRGHRAGRSNRPTSPPIALDAADGLQPAAERAGVRIEVDAGPVPIAGRPGPAAPAGHDPRRQRHPPRPAPARRSGSRSRPTAGAWPDPRRRRRPGIPARGPAARVRPVLAGAGRPDRRDRPGPEHRGLDRRAARRHDRRRRTARPAAPASRSTCRSADRPIASSPTPAGFITTSGSPRTTEVINDPFRGDHPACSSPASAPARPASCS